MTSHEQLLNAARKYIGVPFKWHGRDYRGLDCCGLLLKAANDVFGTNYDFHNYGETLNSLIVFKAIKEWTIRINPSEAINGDIILALWNRQSVHFGFITPIGILQADYQRKKVIEEQLPIYIRRVAFFRAKEIVNGR